LLLKLLVRKYEEAPTIWEQDVPQEAPQEDHIEMPSEIMDADFPIIEPFEESKAADVSPTKTKVAATPDIRVSTVKNALSEVSETTHPITVCMYVRSFFCLFSKKKNYN